MKYTENIQQLAELHPDYMGFIFYPGSKRFVGNKFEMPTLPDTIKKVGVFVNETSDTILDVVSAYHLDFIQLHGNESADFCNYIAEEVKTIKAFGIDEHFDFSILDGYKKSCTYFLFDTKSPEHGGTGKSFDWKILEKYDNEIPFFLSGGIDENSLTELENHKNLNIHALDINSKFETEPGLKNIENVKQFMKELSSISNSQIQ